ncbi:EAL domain-containing protein [Rhizobiales bacterium]|uniref:GGDEF/EAL domain-containing response regulator n=1 Tax=Hongsoonwoonella zoysiae TaxID=2821844 RepID=UPI0015601F4A|nr:EAL domain-containing protein [Hongsoonwoonella zoysiae]NRG17493.1 EAL domain-containing protein [Hongsoonwoonella zoysiae]
MSVIAVVDDRMINRNFFSRLASWTEDGVVTRAFANPFDALEHFRNETPDLLITDYRMPKMDGAEFTRRFRTLPGCSDIPVMVITAFADRRFRMRALEAGATDFLQSPVDHSEFQTRARNLLALRKRQLAMKSRASDLEQELQIVERERDEAMRDSRERLLQVIDTVQVMISAVDRAGSCVFVNAYQAQLLGKEAGDLTGISLYPLMYPSEIAENARALDRRVFDTGEPLAPYEEEVLVADGSTRVFLTRKVPLKDKSGKVVNVLSTSLDVTENKRAEAHLFHIAHHDALTELPNRTLLGERLDEEITRDVDGESLFALHFLDLDRFKGINDALGHTAGDRLLEFVADRLKACVRGTDLVARLGGDEFAVLQTSIAGMEDALSLARRIIEELEDPFYINGQEVKISASIGFTMYPSDGSSSEALLRNADLAMYRAKAEGGGVFCSFAEGMDETARQAVAMEAELRHALVRSELELHFQPQIDLKDRRVIGAEALLRWHHPERGFITPGMFLPVAEESGLIYEIGEWVLNEACQQAVRWQQAGLGDLRIAVNISPTQFRKQSVSSLVRQALAASRLSPELLEIEITENVVMQGAERVLKDLQDIREQGVQVAIDDFGTGYSSLAYLKRFKVDRLKIDQCFVRTMEEDISDAAIIDAVIGLGKSLDLHILAEGVERAEQAELLARAGCDEAQGYFFGRPMPSKLFVKSLSPQGMMVAGSENVVRTPGEKAVKG